MRYLIGEELHEAMRWMRGTGCVAEAATCLRAKCGVMIVKNDRAVGVGHNSPPGGDLNRKCEVEQSVPPNYRHDQTCCVHAEWRAIMQAIRHDSDQLRGSTLYFTRVDDKGQLLRSGKPYCTVCSRLILDVGIKYVILWHEEGMALYDTVEFNNLSYAYTGA